MPANAPAKFDEDIVIPVDEQTRPLANSERIQLMFGNYAIEVLENDPGIRVSSLYSTHEGVRVNRTFAVVAYPDVIEHAFRKEHDAIVKGQSIGTLFKDRGWVLEKHHRYFGEIETPVDLFCTTLKPRSDRKARSAIHVYTLVVKKEDSEFEYASIAEIHHPEFLQLDDLMTIYGPAITHKQEDLARLESFLTVVGSRINAMQFPTT